MGRSRATGISSACPSMAAWCGRTTSRRATFHRSWTNSQTKKRFDYFLWGDPMMPRGRREDSIGGPKPTLLYSHCKTVEEHFYLLIAHPLLEVPVVERG